MKTTTISDLDPLFGLSLDITISENGNTVILFLNNGNEHDPVIVVDRMELREALRLDGEDDEN